MFRHSFANRRRSLSVGFNTTFTRNSSENILDGRYRFFDDMGNVTDSLPNQFYDNLTNGTNYEGNLTYTEPLGKSGMLQFEYNPSIQKIKPISKPFISIMGSTQHLIHRYPINSIIPLPPKTVASAIAITQTGIICLCLV